MRDIQNHGLTWRSKPDRIHPLSQLHDPSDRFITSFKVEAQSFGSWARLRHQRQELIVLKSITRLVNHFPDKCVSNNDSLHPVGYFVLNEPVLD